MSESPSTYQISRRQLYFIIALGSAFLIANVLLIKQNWELKNLLIEQAGAPPGLPRGRPVELEPGQALTPLDGLDADGNRASFSYDGEPRKTLLLSFAPECGPCEENMPVWEALVKGLDARSFRVVAVSLVPTGVKEYVGRHDLGAVPVIANVDSEDRAAYKLRTTPQTILIGPDGKVEKVWTGLLKGERRKEVEEALGVQLPGV